MRCGCADHRRLPLRKSRSSHGKIPRRLPGARPETASPMIERRDELSGPLDEASAGRFEIADKCPAHRTLHSEVLITTRLTDPA